MSPKEVPKAIYDKYENFGYSRILIQAAYEICASPENEISMIDTMTNLQKENEFLMSSSAKVNHSSIYHPNPSYTLLCTPPPSSMFAFHLNYLTIKTAYSNGNSR